MKRKKTKKSTFLSIPIIISILIFLYTRNIYISFIGIFMYLIIITIIKYARTEFKNKKLIKSGIDMVDKMSGEEFEIFLLAHFKKLGYHVQTTPKTSDYGADLILTKNREKIVVQAKRWSYKVGIEAVQQVLGAKSYYGASKCLVVTSNLFTPNAKTLANSSKVELWDRNKLLEVMYKANGIKLIEELFNVRIDEIKNRMICEKCGSNLILRNGTKGKFYGCTNFPKCKFTKNIS